jgi:hypothetical protein
MLDLDFPLAPPSTILSFHCKLLLRLGSGWQCMFLFWDPFDDSGPYLSRKIFFDDGGYAPLPMRAVGRTLEGFAQKNVMVQYCIRFAYYSTVLAENGLADVAGKSGAFSRKLWSPTWLIDWRQRKSLDLLNLLWFAS